MNNNIFEKVDDYISSKLKLDDDKALTDTLKSLEANNIPNISVSPAQGRFLQVLAKSCGAKKILELGTLVGYSTICMARALPESGKLITIEYDLVHSSVSAENIKNAGLSDKVEIRTGKALDILPKLEEDGEGPFDMIFIDADKPPYPEYFKWAVRLSRPGTLIIADNVIRDGKVLDSNNKDENVIGVQSLNKMLADMPEVTASIMQNVGAKEHDGMVIAVVN